jgi:hypothetical protein
MASVGRRRFAEAVTETFETVRHLFRAIDRLNVDLRDALKAPPTALQPIGGTSVGRVAGRRDDDRQVIRAWYGRLHAPDLRTGDEPEEDEPPGDDPEEDGEPRHSRRRPPLPLSCDDRLLALKLVLFEAGKPRFEPVVRYAVIGGWVVKGRSESGYRPERFTIPRNMLRRLLRPLSPAVDGGEYIPTDAKARLPKAGRVGKGKGANRLSYRCYGGIQEMPLYGLDSPQAIVSLASSMKRHWRHFGGRPRTRRKKGSQRSR